MKGSGYYVATVDSSTGRRYRGRGLLARGNGEWEIAEDGLSYRRYLTKVPIVVPAEAIEDVTVNGSWFGGKWMPGNRVVLVTWRHEGTSVRSGFVFSGKRDVNDAAAEELRRAAGLTG